MQNKKKPPMTMGQGAREVPGMVNELTGGGRKRSAPVPAQPPQPRMTGKEAMSPGARRQMQEIQQRRAAAQPVKPMATPKPAKPAAQQAPPSPKKKSPKMSSNY